MKDWYTVRVRVTDYLDVNVIAESEEEAIATIYKEVNAHTFDQMKWEHDSEEYEVVNFMPAI